jgi:PAS domain S-box-containing protein
MLTYISPSGIFLTDIQGKIIFVNPSWCEIAEIPQRGALNNKWFEAIHPDDKNAVRQKQDDAIRTKEALYNRFRFAHKGSAIILVLNNLTYILKGRVDLPTLSGSLLIQQVYNLFVMHECLFT